MRHIKGPVINLVCEFRTEMFLYVINSSGASGP